MDRSQTVFLICSERSGSNLITKVMDAHPDFCGPSPLHLIRIFSKNLFRYGNIENDENWRLLIQDMVAVIDTQLGRWKTQWTETDLLTGIKNRRLAAVINYIYNREKIAGGKKHLFIKENRVHTFLPFILANYPQSKFLLLVRDPRDMALSWKLSPNHPGGVSRAAAVWIEDQQKSIEVMGYLGLEGRIMKLRYEDFLQYPERCAESLCRFLDMSYHAGMLRFFENDLTVENANRLKDWSNLKRPLMRKNFNKYKSGLSSTEIRYVETLCRETMTVFGYVPEFGDSSDQWDDIQETIAAMEARLIASRAPHQPTEETIREKRLAVIQRILSRDRFDFSDCEYTDARAN